MFAVRFDDFKRKLEKNNIVVTKLVTAMQNTEEYNTYMGLFLMPENKAIDIIVEEDGSTFTFFTLKVLPLPEAEPELLTVSNTDPESEGA